jgi:hypothetical protein
MPPNEPCPTAVNSFWIGTTSGTMRTAIYGQTMILTREEIALLDVYCREGTEPPFGGPATDVMRSIGVQDGDTLNLQWAYLHGQPPTGPAIGRAGKVASPLPWANREAVLRRDAEIRAIREERQRARSSQPTHPEGGVDDSHEAVDPRMEGE